MKISTPLLLALIITIFSLPSRAAPPAPAELEALGLKAVVSEGTIVEVSGDTTNLRPEDMALIARCTGIRTLRLKGPGLDDTSLTLLSPLANLETLSSDGCNLSDDGFRHFAAFPKLQSISLFHPSRNNTAFTGSGLAHLAALPSLRTLTFAGAKAGDPALDGIATLQQLRKLSMWHNLETQEGNAKLGEMTWLTSLKIGQRLPSGAKSPPSFDSTTIPVIARMKGLETLELTEAYLTATDIAPIAALPNLKTLVIKQVQLPEDDIEKLRTLLPKIKIDHQPMLMDDEIDLLQGKLRLVRPANFPPPPAPPVSSAASPIAPGATPVKVAGDFKFTEGPSADSLGNVYFTDQPNNRILRWSTDGVLTTFLEPAGRSNGLCFDAKGKLWACADENNQLWRIDPATKKHEVVVADFEGKLLNGPNDVWVHPNGGAYFTDPFFKRPYWNRGPSEQPGNQVFYLAADGTNLRRVTTDLTQTNGLVGSADGKTLYVADPGQSKVFAYDIQTDGSLAKQRVFCRGKADGLTLDSAGNLYLAGKGVSIFGPDGILIVNVPIPENWTANLCFGGPKRSTLFITASTGLYTLQTTVTGAGPQ